jgi:TonB family protein
MQRIERAPAQAALQKLKAAANELENIRASANDSTLRNVTTLMLLGIYLEEGNYGRSQSLLEGAFQQRAAQKDESLRTYFAAAGQTLNGIRAHLARYRSYGLNPTEPAGLPAEANTDLERVRSLLERVIAQANEIGKEAKRSYEAFALLEDVLGIRLSLARDNDDHGKWQTEYLLAREKMAASQPQVASLGRSPALDAVTNRIPNPFATKTSAGNGNSDAVPAPTPISPNTSLSTGPEPPLVTMGSLSGRETKRVTPVYPSTAKSTGISGTVRVFAIVDENGKIWVTNSEGPMLLRRAAEEAAKGWTFPPSLVNSKPVRIAGYLDFEFKL